MFFTQFTTNIFKLILQNSTKICIFCMKIWHSHSSLSIFFQFEVEFISIQKLKHVLIWKKKSLNLIINVIIDFISIAHLFNDTFFTLHFVWSYSSVFFSFFFLIHQRKIINHLRSCASDAGFWLVARFAVHNVIALNIAFCHIIYVLCLRLTNVRPEKSILHD